MATKKTPKEEDRTLDGHHLEKDHGNGYTKEGDKYYISPGNASVMDEILVDQAAINSYVAQLNAFIVDRMELLEKRKRRWWDARIAGMDLPKAAWEYDSARHCIVITPETKKGAE